MSGYGVREARINKARQPRVNVCGSCGRECDSLLCDDCTRGIAGAEYATRDWEPVDEQERRTR